MNDAAAIGLDLDDLREDWGAMKLTPAQTGLPMAVWITENAGYRHDVRVKVSPLHGGHGAWPAAISVGVRPSPHEIRPGTLATDDFALVYRWIELNREMIIDFWDGRITGLDVGGLLRRLG
jgi:hypothetical protein